MAEIIDPVQREILYDGLDDWGALQFHFILIGWRRFRKKYWTESAENVEEAKNELVNALETLGGAGLIEIGSVDSAGFTPWQHPIEVSIRIIREKMRTGDDWEFFAWTNNTPAGVALAESFDPDEFPDDDD
jgi:hypothetical protein